MSEPIRILKEHDPRRIVGTYLGGVFRMRVGEEISLDELFEAFGDQGIEMLAWIVEGGEVKVRKWRVLEWSVRDRKRGGDMRDWGVLAGVRRLWGCLIPCRRELRRITRHLEGIEMKMSQYLAEMVDLKSVVAALAGQITKVQGEILGKIDDLQKQIAALEEQLADVDVPAEGEATLAEMKTLTGEIRARLQGMDDITPD